MTQFAIDDKKELKPRISVIGVGGAGGNAVNNMIRGDLQGVKFIACNTDAQALSLSLAESKIQLGFEATQGLGAGSHPEVGRISAEESIHEVTTHID
ncbi:MAG: cell division protein FtsZ, partial [Caedimonadaceae bacterium]